MRTGTVLLAACSLSLAGCNFEDFEASERYRSDFRFSYPLSPGGSFTLENTNGPVEISGWDQNTVEITGTKYGRTEALRDEVKIDIDHSGNSVAIRTVIPSGVHEMMGARYVVRVPRKVQLNRVVSTNGAVRVNDVEGSAHVRTSNGAIHVGRMQGDLEAQTTNGSIEAADIAGAAHMHTSNGRVRAEAILGTVEATTTNGGVTVHEPLADSRASVRVSTSNGPVDITFDGQLRSDVHANTTNGSITMHVPSDTAARITASTSHQAITSDLDVTMQGHIDKHHLEGAIGAPASGSPSIELSTTNGHIRLLRL